MDEIAYAKLNLALHVRGREPDGYHRLETLFAFAEDGDRLSVAEGEGLSLAVVGPFAGAIGPTPDNLVTRAAEALRSRYAVAAGAALTLEKNLPVASGIGGGSADAAAALRLLARWWQLHPEPEALHEIAALLGADMPACLASVTAFGEGKGDLLTPVASDLAGCPLLLVNPGVAVPTGPVFRAWDGQDRGPLARDPSLAAIRAARNDLQAAAIGVAPAIREVLDALETQPGTRLVRMSGSGATCFALFGSLEDRDAACQRLASTPWWRFPSRLR
jgi:4-diphosphocytidyl-2-C-methyl-D-erythritol kinase